MLTAMDVNDQQMWAREVDQSDGPFVCPKCEQSVTLRKGKLRVHHFAHRPDSDCSFGTGETELHRRVKEEIYLTLREANVPCILEGSIGDQRADVLAIVNGKLVAIEVQASVLSIDEIRNRTASYADKGIYVLWILPEEMEREAIYDYYLRQTKTCIPVRAHDNRRRKPTA